MIDPFVIHILHEIGDEDERYELRIQRRHLRDVSDPFTTSEGVFKGIYRLSREVTLQLVQDISPFFNIQREEVAVPVVHRILSTLHVISQGSYQKCAGQDFFIPMAQQTLSKCIREVTSIIVNHLGNHISFPTTPQEEARIKVRFLEKGGFPGIIGAIDCTHIAIQAPPYNHPEMPGIVFLNRKGFYSINTQIVVDADLKILAVNARFPGSVHDAAIWTTSTVKRFLQNEYVNGNTDSWLIGDSGYPLQPILMTPVVGNNLREAELNYNRVHKSCRNVVERLNGVLRQRFRCCLGHRTLHYKPEIAANIIYTCCILHNICIDRGDDGNIDRNNDILINEVDMDRINDNIENDDANLLNEGRRIRQRIINNYLNGN